MKKQIISGLLSLLLVPACQSFGLNWLAAAQFAQSLPEYESAQVQQWYVQGPTTTLRTGGAVLSWVVTYFTYPDQQIDECTVVEHTPPRTD